MSGLQQTYNANPPVSNRADFNRTDFETIIQQKGRNVLLEKSLDCPCKGRDTNQQSNCKNCGGTGYIFINPKQTRMVLQGMNITPNYKAWSEEIIGDLRVTASDNEELTYMDRITVLDAEAIFNEVLHFKTKGAVTFAYTTYNIKQIKYIGYFRGTDQTFLRLVQGDDYVFSYNTIKLINPDLTPIQGQISVTIRYIHAPQYHMIDMKRESMETFEMVGNEKLVHLPISGTARRAHYILTANNLTGDRLLNNSYLESCSEQSCDCNTTVTDESCECSQPDTYNVDSDFSFQVGANTYIISFVVLPNTGTINLNVGTTQNGTEVIDDVESNRNDPTIVINKFFESPATLYVTGITKPTIIKVYYIETTKTTDDAHTLSSSSDVDVFNVSDDFSASILANKIIDTVLVLPAAGTMTVSIGTTNFGTNILDNVDVSQSDPIVVVNKYFAVDTTIYFTGISGLCTVKIYYK